MRKCILKTGERLIPEDIEYREEYLLYLRQLCAYEFVKGIIPKVEFVRDLHKINPSSHIPHRLTGINFNIFYHDMSEDGLELTV